MALFDITSANATAVLTVEDLYPNGIVLQMFGADTGIALDTQDIVEARVGVDGYMVAGQTPNLYTVTVTLEAASPSYQPLSIVWNAMQTRRTIYDCKLVCDVPSLKRVFTLSTGVLQSGVIFPNIERTLSATTWVFVFQNLDVAGS